MKLVTATAVYIASSTTVVISRPSTKMSKIQYPSPITAIRLNAILATSTAVAQLCTLDYICTSNPEIWLAPFVR
jgi:hypothetical protein